MTNSTTSEHYFIPTKTPDKCAACDLDVLSHPELPRHNLPTASEQRDTRTMTLSTEQLNKILETAEKAKAFSDAPQHLTRYDHGGGRLTRIQHTDTGAEYRTLVADFYEEADREHYATFDPSTCAELIREVVRLRGELDGGK